MTRTAASARSARAPCGVPATLGRMADPLQLHAQRFYHQPAHIIGSPEALRRLRDAIDQTLADGRWASVDGVEPGDDEGYECFVLARRSVQGVRAPYTEAFAAETDPHAAPPHDIADRAGLGPWAHPRTPR